jgi:hypothetical protein
MVMSDPFGCGAAEACAEPPATDVQAAALAAAGRLQARPRTMADMTTTHTDAAHTSHQGAGHTSAPLSHSGVPNASLQPAVDRFLAAVQAGVLTADLYTTDATLDATVPGWRFHRHGAASVSAEYAGWFASPGQLEELERILVADGEVITYLLTWEEHGVPHAAHHSHRIVVDPETGRIASDRVFCGGRWNAELLASMAEAGR